MRRQTTNSAHHMGDHLWAITTLNPKKIHIQCITQDTWKDLIPLLQFIAIPNGCEATAEDIWIPPSMRIAAQASDMQVMGQCFLGFTENYIATNDIELYKG